MTENDRRYVARSLQSVREQTLAPSEILLYVDERNSWIEVEIGTAEDVAIRRIPFCCASVARNRAVVEARCDWIAFLDADDTWLAEKLRIQYAETLNSAADLSAVDYTYNTPEGIVYAVSRSIHAVPPSNWLVKRSVMLRQPFDPELNHSEDMEWLIRTAGLIKACRIRHILTSMTMRVDSKTALDTPEHPHQKKMRVMRALAATPVLPLLRAATYLRYVCWLHTDWWHYQYPRMLAAKHPLAEVAQLNRQRFQSATQQ